VPNIIKEEAANGAVPNLIHAFDASLVMMTANAAIASRLSRP
jgi:hypothetical protein